MSLTRSLTTSVRSATYNPEAEKALQEERKKAQEAKDIIQKYLDDNEQNAKQKTKENEWPAKSLETYTKVIDKQRKFLADNPELPADQYTEKGKIIKKEVDEAFGKLFFIGIFSVVTEYFGLKLQEAEANKLYARADQQALQSLYQELDSFLKKADEKTFAEIIAFVDNIGKRLQPLAQKVNLNLNEASPEKSKELKGRLEVKKAAEDKKFSFKRFIQRVSATTTTVVNALLYTMFALVMGMLAANDAIGREPMYRILYFFYGFIFAPFLGLYYLYRWFKGTAPKIYTMLPYSQIPAETSLGRFFKFPFYWKEDKPARDLMVQFLTESAEAVGKKFDPTSLGSLGQQVEQVAENLKNLSQQTAEQVGEVAKGTVAAFPNVSKLQVNK